MMSVLKTLVASLPSGRVIPGVSTTTIAIPIPNELIASAGESPGNVIENRALLTVPSPNLKA